MKRAVIVLLVGSSALVSSISHALSGKYDAEIRHWSEVYMGGGDEFEWLKAQLIQESRLNPLATSPVGAMGLGQIMPATWREICLPLAICHKSPYNPGASIKAAAYYQARMERIWKSPRPGWDRKALGLASYNAGAGNLIKAQRACGGAILYHRIIACLPDITGRHAEETITYVQRINAYRAKLRAGLL